jgi:hypothetical protein
MVGQHVLSRQLSGNLGNQPRTRKLLSDHAEELLVEFSRVGGFTSFIGFRA